MTSIAKLSKHIIYDEIYDEIEHNIHKYDKINYIYGWGC